MEKKVGIREAKINLSKLIKLVQNGDRVIITDRGKSVVKLVSVEWEDRSLSDRIAIMEQAGLIGPSRCTGDFVIPAPLPLPDGLAQKYLLESRDE
ncbi:type II toxin-antitoxin system Phd/YefM family antitoxin [bacterium]|nr:type II toxin-antitoxin system Phd/YefM family antitoxin [bacterium]